MVSGMRTPLRPAVLLIAVAFALTGCSAPDAVSGGVSEATATESSAPLGTDGGAAELDAEPANGELIAGSGYTFIVPAGWTLGAPQAQGGVSTDSVATNTADTDGFVDNVNVLAPQGLITADDVETSGAESLAQTWGTEVEVRERISVAGADSAHISANLTASGVSYAIEQYYLTSGDQTFVVTFSFSDTMPAAEREEIAESVLVTWAWA